MAREGVKDVLEEAYPGIEKGRLNNYGGQLWAFVSRIEKGDLIVLPLKGQGTIAIGEVTGPYRFESGNPAGAQHTRTVKWLRDDLPRDNFDQDLLYSFGAFMTVCRIIRNNAEERIQAILKGKPLSVQVGKSAGDELEETEAQANPEEQAKTQLRKYISQKFIGHKLADLVHAILEAQGYKCLVSEPGPDGGVDIIAGHGEMGFESPRLCVQVKSGGPVDVKIVRELRGVMQDVRADKGLVVSWGGFKNSVLSEEKRSFFDIRLWSSEVLLDMIQTHYERFPDELKADLPLKRIWALVLED